MSSAPILITSGEPAGIGPDLCLLLAAQGALNHASVLGSPEVFAERRRALGLDVAISSEAQHDALHLLPIPTAVRVRAGQPDPANARHVLDQLDYAAAAMQRGQYRALVTAPVHKGVINDAGIPFTGHTEYFQAHAGVDKVVMMLACPGLRVALVTTHLPLRDVADAVTADAVMQTIRITEQALRHHFHIPTPRIAVCGLNPHAGEDGHLGDEEQRIIIPVLEQLRDEGIDLSDPLPADSLLVPRYSDAYDAVIAMYHDQGLPVLKARGFGQAVNITLGLPYIRTSVDHGTALSLAGSGYIDCGSLRAALECAVTMSAKRNLQEQKYG